MELEKAAALAPGDPVTHYLLGRAYLMQGQEERATESLRRSVAAAPALFDAWFELARAYRTMGTAAEAIEAYREIIRQKPDHAEAHFQLAKLYKRLSDNLTFQLRGDEESAPGPGVLAHDWQVYLMRLGDQAQDYRQIALEEFALALRLRPSDHEILRQIGEIHRRSGKLEEAQSIFRWLADRRPEHWVHFYRLGTIAVELGQLERAMEALRTATALAPHQGDPRLALGLAYLLGGRISEAIDSFRRAAIYEPFNPTLYTNLGAAYARRGDYGPARAALRRSLELSTFPLPRRHLTYTNLALVHLKQGRRSEAAQALKQALDAHPGYDTARRLLDALDERGETGAADLVAEIGFVVNDRLEIFGEVTTVALDNE
jgi:tetratricopeptide (TPR) repeat protein